MDRHDLLADAQDKLAELAGLMGYVGPGAGSEELADLARREDNLRDALTRLCNAMAEPYQPTPEEHAWHAQLAREAGVRHRPMKTPRRLKSGPAHVLAGLLLGPLDVGALYSIRRELAELERRLGPRRDCDLADVLSPAQLAAYLSWNEAKRGLEDGRAGYQDCYRWLGDNRPHLDLPTIGTWRRHISDARRRLEEAGMRMP